MCAINPAHEGQITFKVYTNDKKLTSKQFIDILVQQALEAEQSLNAGPLRWHVQDPQNALGQVQVLDSSDCRLIHDALKRFDSIAVDHGTVDCAKGRLRLRRLIELFSSATQSGEPTGAGEVVPTAHADNAEQKSSAQETST